jgi:hypothetical protein
MDMEKAQMMIELSKNQNATIQISEPNYAGCLPRTKARFIDSHGAATYSESQSARFWNSNECWVRDFVAVVRFDSFGFWSIHLISHETPFFFSLSVKSTTSRSAI